MIVTHVCPRQVSTKIMCETDKQADSEFDAIEPLSAWDSRTECQILQRLQSENDVKPKIYHKIPCERQRKRKSL